jgi:hypothetical protein
VSLLPHDVEPEAVRALVGRVEPGTVVGNDELGASVPLRQLHPRVRGAGVLRDVVQCFLRDAIEGDLRVGGEIAIPFDLDADPDAAATSGRLRELEEEVAEGCLCERRRPQLEQQRTHLCKRSAREVAELGQTPSPLVLVAFPELRQHLGDEARREERLRHSIVQVPGEPAALG